MVPTWCGSSSKADAQIAPLLELGTLIENTLDVVRYGTSLSVFDPHIVNGRRTFIETCSLPALDDLAVDALIERVARAVSAGCAVFTREFKGAASRVPAKATAFGLRRGHVLIEILALLPDRSDAVEEELIGNGLKIRGGRSAQSRFQADIRTCSASATRIAPRIA